MISCNVCWDETPLEYSPKIVYNECGKYSTLDLSPHDMISSPEPTWEAVPQEAGYPGDALYTGPSWVRRKRNEPLEGVIKLQLWKKFRGAFK